MTSVSRVAPPIEPDAETRRAGRGMRPIRWRPRWSLTHLVMVVAGLLAFVAVLAVLRERDAVIRIPVVRSAIAAGEPITFGAVDLVIAHGPSAGLSTAAVTAEEYEAAVREGLVAARHIPADSLLSAVDLVEPGGVAVDRTMSIPVAADDAVGRSLVRGDIVDIVAVVDGIAMFVATGVEVVAVASNGGPATASASVGVEVDAPASLRLASALSRTEVRLVRATGAPPVDPAEQYPPLEGSSDER